MENSLLVSIIIPVYNVEKYLDECIDSVAKQTYKNIEIILVNDGSTDKSGSICDKWAQQDARVKVIHKKNQGPNYARRDGVLCSSGSFIMFVDSDDLIVKSTIHDMLPVMKDQKADLVAGGYFPFTQKRQLSAVDPVFLEYNKRSTENPRVITIKDPAKIYEYFITRHRLPNSRLVPFSSISPAMKLIARQLVEMVDWDSSNYRRGEDLPMMRFIYQNAKCLVEINKIFYFYRQIENSRSHNGANSFTSSDGKSMGIFEFFDEQLQIDKKYIKVKGYNLQDQLLWQEIFSYFWYLKDEIGNGNFDASDDEVKFLDDKLPKLIVDVEKSGGLYDKAKKMGIEEPYREFLRIVKNYGVRAYVEYYKQYEKSQKIIADNNSEIVQLKSKLTAMRAEITGKNAELERLMGIKASARRLAGNVVRRAKRDLLGGGDKIHIPDSVRSKQYKVSIIVPCYNVAEYLPKCLDSLVNQSYKNIEILVVSDASPDNSAQIAQKYAKKDDRIKVIELPQNQGLFRARLAGLDNMTGDYFTGVDPDDWANQNYILELLIKAVEQKADIVSCQGFTIAEPAENSTVINFSKYKLGNIMSYAPDFDKFIQKMGQEHNGWTFCGKLYSKPLYDKSAKYLHKVKRHLIMGEDIIYSTIFGYFCEQYALDDDNFDYCYFHRQESAENSKSTRTLRKNLDDIKAVMVEIRKFLKKIDKYQNNQQAVRKFEKFLLSRHEID